MKSHAAHCSQDLELKLKIVPKVYVSQEPPSWHPASPEVKQAAIDCRKICADAGTDLARIAIKFFVRSAPTYNLTTTMHASSERNSAHLHSLPRTLYAIREEAIDAVSIGIHSSF